MSRTMSVRWVAEKHLHGKSHRDKTEGKTEDGARLMPTVLAPAVFFVGSAGRVPEVVPVVVVEAGHVHFFSPSALAAPFLVMKPCSI